MKRVFVDITNCREQPFAMAARNCGPNFPMCTSRT